MKEIYETPDLELTGHLPEKKIAIIDDDGERDLVITSDTDIEVILD